MLARFAQVRDELDAMFPEQRSIDANLIAVAGPGDLPRIPGHEVEAVLGRGGMGVVYKAWHLRLNRPVAVKMMLAGGYAGPPELARFLREAETMARLGHPNVVQVYDVGDIDGLPYFTMEYVEGGNLAEKLKGVPQPAREAATLVAVLAGAVEAAHRRGIVHRDLKPANVLLTEDGTPKISDFGLARWTEPWVGVTWTGARLGTPSYMAPEQAAGQMGMIGPTTDVYALGAVLYEMLTGRPPFRAETTVETERQVISEEPVAPSKLNARVPRDLETICLKCLRKSPQKRYPTASALAEDLHRFLRGEPIEARPVGLPERTARWVLRRPTQSTMLVASLVLAIMADQRQPVARSADGKPTARCRGRTSRGSMAPRRCPLGRSADRDRKGRGLTQRELAPRLVPAGRPGPERPRPCDAVGHYSVEAGNPWRTRILQGASEPRLRGGFPAGRAGNDP